MTLAHRSPRSRPWIGSCGRWTCRPKIPLDLDAQAGLYRSLLAGRQMVVVLDNAATSEQVRPLLPGSPTCVVVVTSRSQLSGLVAREGAYRLMLDVLSREDAVTLLRQAIGAGRVDAEPAAAAEVARQCDYLPLALRIAAERASARTHLRLADLAAELAVECDRLDVLTADDDEIIGSTTTSMRRQLAALSGLAAAVHIHHQLDERWALGHLGSLLSGLGHLS